MLHLVQITDATSRRVAKVQEPNLLCLEGVSSVYELAQKCLSNKVSMTEYAETLTVGEVISYDEVYGGRSKWKLLAPIDFPGSSSRLSVSGTGLTHLGSAKERQAMHVAGHSKQEEVVTDSMRMFQWGVEGGRPAKNEVGIAPEWFYKGDASIVRAPFEALSIPGFAEDGGEEAEIAGVYVIDDDGVPHRIGMTAGNEFSDHMFEKKNYLNLAGSKLRVCSLGPELVVGAAFNDVQGEVEILRGQTSVWRREIASGEANMCHSLANLEHHHFKFDLHRQPGSVHVHFFGANALSFGDGVVLQEDDVAKVKFEGFGRALCNSIHRDAVHQTPVGIRSLA